MQLFFLDQHIIVKKTLMQTLALQLSLTLMQLMFLFGQDMRIQKTLVQTLASQVTSTFMQLLFSFGQNMIVNKYTNSCFSNPCNSCFDESFNTSNRGPHILYSYVLFRCLKIMVLKMLVYLSKIVFG